ncbi:MAG: ATP-binding protein [Salinivirgaceae bacterium]|nr:ATP-binding protein [Salinivirgaceae bacterium]
MNISNRLVRHVLFVYICNQKRAMIQRKILDDVSESLQKANKIVILYGARQTGKTTLSNAVISGLKGRVLKINADELKYIETLSSRDFQQMKLLIEGYDCLFIDEAQRIPNIGINLKIIHDNMPDLKILVTGSSSFDLANQLNEPLTGRTITYKLFPLALCELHKEMNIFELKDSLSTYLIYGMYPGLRAFDSAIGKEKHLTELSTAYLYKDIFELSAIRNPSKLRDLLKLLAFQIGSEVSIRELSQNLNIDQATVDGYIDLLEKSFIVFRLGGFSRNLRKEISKKQKIYFWDTGIRNSLINNFSTFDFRNDMGALWENFVIAERIKYLSYNNLNTLSYFWRTYTGAEIDYIEERNGRLSAFEIKVKSQNAKIPQTWADTYGGEFFTIHQDNFQDFLL